MLVVCVGLSEDEGLVGVHDEAVHVLGSVKDLHLRDGAWHRDRLECHRPTLSAKRSITAGET